MCPTSDPMFPPVDEDKGGEAVDEGMVAGTVIGVLLAVLLVVSMAVM